MTHDKQPWHADREEVFAAMRHLNDWIQQRWEQERKLRPPQGTIGMGGADFDYFLKAVVGETYLRCLRHGKSPFFALGAAKAAGLDCVRRWNNHGCKSRLTVNDPRHKFELQHWDGAGASTAEHIHALFLAWLPKKIAQEVGQDGEDAVSKK